MPHIVISPLLQEQGDFPGRVAVEGQTVEGCLKAFFQKFPDAENWLFPQEGQMRVILILNNQEALPWDEEGVKRTIGPDEEIKLLAVPGGG